MGRIVFVGGGIVGTCAAMMLANDGHDVTVLERDPAAPPPPDGAWDQWDRRGVNQFKMLHYFLARFRQTADAELPGLSRAYAPTTARRSRLTSSSTRVDAGRRWRPGCVRPVRPVRTR